MSRRRYFIGTLMNSGLAISITKKWSLMLMDINLAPLLALDIVLFSVIFVSRRSAAGDSVSLS